jgi:DNA-binding NtrC family response regulator
VLTRRIESRAEFAAALQDEWDAVLSDYNLPGFTGIDALQMLRERGSALPFILVSGAIGEDTAVAAMRNGASDYLLKNNLARLAPALEHAIAAAEAQRARESADRELQASRQRLSELAQHLQTSVEMERSGDRARDPRRRRRLADGAEVRPRLDPPPQRRPGRAAARVRRRRWRR